MTTGAISYGAWSDGHFAAFDVDQVPGYTASPSVVPAVDVNDESADSQVEIHYTRNGQPVTPVGPDHPVNPDHPLNPNQPTQPGQPTTPGHQASQQNVNGGIVDHQQAGNNGQAAMNQLNNQSRANGSRAGRLPQTGNNHDTSGSLLGLLLLSFLGFFGFGKRKKDQRDE